MSNTLLPQNASKSELAQEASTAARLKAIPVPIRDVWNPDKCPVDLLPWLAWAFSVDTWDPTWTELQKRTLIKNSILIHKYKGTIGAVRRALESIGYTWRIVEWFEEIPPGPHHTFRVEIGVTGVGITDERYESIVRLVMDAKNVRSQLSTMLVHADVNGTIRIASCQLSGSETDVWPFWGSEVEKTHTISIASALCNGETTFVIPFGMDPGDFTDDTIWDGELEVIDPTQFTLNGAYPDGGTGAIDPADYQLVGIP